MENFNFYDWATVIVIAIEVLVVILAITEGEEKNSKSLVLTIKFESKWKQRISRCLIAVVCPLLYVSGASFRLHEQGFKALQQILIDATGLVCLLIALDLALFVVVFKIGCPLKNLITTLLIKFKNWLWN